MRILRYFLSGLLLVSIIGISAFFIFREVAMYWGVSTLRESVKALAQAQNQGSYQTQCHQEGRSIGPNGVIMQLRFLSDTEYVTEALCNEASTLPISVGRESLPPFVTKVQGESGFIANGSVSGIELAAFEDLGNELEQALRVSSTYITKSKILQLEEGILLETVDPTVLGNGPITSCTGYGYTCCRDEAEKGIGDRIAGLFDCEQSCYSQCVSRPLLLSFTSNPFYDIQTRTVTIPTGTTVEFIYVGDGGQSDTVSGFLEFGDGGSEPITEESGQADHTYTCATASCSYVARVLLTDKWGVDSAELPVTKINIVVQGK